MSLSHQFILFLQTKFLLRMDTLELPLKIHDEERQGEAFAPFHNDPNHYQKEVLYRKLWLRNEFC